MTKQLVYLIGAPGAGKSTLLAAATQRCRADEENRGHGLWLRWLVPPFLSGPTIVEFGRRRKEFSGTDALGMAVMPHATACVRDLTVPVIVGEGDRLASTKFFDAARDADRTVKLVWLDTPDDVADVRRAGRGSKQSATWIAGRITKTRRLVDSAEGHGYDLIRIDGTEPFADQIPRLTALLGIVT